MERIRAAVQRVMEAGGESAAGFTSVRGAGPAVWAPVAPEGPGVIAYTHTRSLRVPDDDLRERRIVSAYGPCMYTDAYKILSTQVSRRLRERDWNTLGVTSAGQTEGKTLTAINLAISLAKEYGQTALLVDADIRHPGVRSRLGLPGGGGLSDHLLEDVPLQQLLINPGIPGFVVLPGGAPQSNSTEILGWRKTGQLVQELKRRYPSRIVIFDLPPLLDSADVLAFAPNIDAILLVVEEGVTTRDDAARAAELVKPGQLLGTVLNKVDTPARNVGESHGGRRRVPGRRSA